MSSRADIMAGKAFVELYVKNSRFMKGLRDAKARMSQFGSEMQAMGRGLAAGGAAMLAPLVFSVATFASFDDEMRKVGARSRGTAGELARLRDIAKELGATTSFTAGQVASLQAKIAQKGFDRSQIADMTGDILNLARAAGEGNEGDTVVAADLVSGNLRAFGKDASEAGALADVFTAAVNNSNFNLEGLTSAMSSAAPIANRYGVSVKDTINVLAQMTNVNIDAASAGTAFRNMMLRMSNEANRSKFNDEVKKMTGNTVDFVNAAGDLKSPPEFLFAIGEAVKDLGSAAQGDILSNLFGLRAVVGGGVLTESKESFRELDKILSNVGGTAQDTADSMDAGLGGMFRIIMSGVEGVKIAIGESLKGALTDVGETIKSVLGIARELVENNQDLVVSYGKWAAGILGAGSALLGIGLVISGVALAIGGLISVVGLAASTFTLAAGLLGGAFAVLTSPITLAVVAIVGIGAAILQATGSIDGLIAVGFSIGEVFGRMRQTVVETFDLITQAIGSGDLALAGEIAMTGLRIVFLQGMEAIASGIGGTMGDVLSTFVTQISGGDFAGVWNTVVLGMSTMWEGFSVGVVNAFVGASQALLDTWLRINRAVLGAWKATVDGIVNYFLDQAGDSAFVSGALELVTGANIKDERDKREKLNAGLRAAGATGGDQTGDIFDQVADVTFSGSLAEKINETVGGAFDNIERLGTGALDGLQTTSQGRLAGAASALVAGTSGSAASDEVARLQAELAEKKENFRKAKEIADAEAVDGIAIGPGGEAVGPDGKPIKGGLGGGATGGGPASFVTSSAAALLANAGGGSSPTLTELQAIRKELVESRKERREQTKVLKEGRLHHA